MNTAMEYSAKQIQIFEGVMTLLREGRPVHGIKVADITESAGIGKSTAYEYFTSKEEIIREALGYHIRENIRIFAEHVFSARSFQGMTSKALDHLEQSLAERSSGILFMILMEHREQFHNGAYLDEPFRQRMETLIAAQIQRITAIGKEEGQIAEEMTLPEVKMVLFGFFTAYVQELVKLKIGSGACTGQRAQSDGTAEITSADPKELDKKIRQLKQRTQKLLLKALR